jgi:hypothetical protein
MLTTVARQPHTPPRNRAASLAAVRAAGALAVAGRNLLITKLDVQSGVGRGCTTRQLLVGGAALVVFAIGHFFGKGVQPALSGGEDYPGVCAGIEADSDSAHEPLRQD